MYAISRLQSPGGFRYWQVLFRRRDRQLRRTAVLTAREFRTLLRSDNRSGAPGVLFIRPKNQPQGSWQAKMRLPGGRRVARTFAVRKYGKPGAFELAVAARAALLDLVPERPFLYHSTAKAFAARPARRARRRKP